MCCSNNIVDVQLTYFGLLNKQVLLVVPHAAILIWFHICCTGAFLEVNNKYHTESDGSVKSMKGRRNVEC